MEGDKKSIFRKESLDHISSPEDLNHYLNVTKPGIWFSLLAVVVLLIGVFFWMIFGQLSTTFEVAVVSNGNDAICYVPFDKAESALAGERVKIAGVEYALTDAGLSPLLVNDDIDINIRSAGALAEGDKIKPLRVDAHLTEGIYSAEITVEMIHPIKFIVN